MANIIVYNQEREPLEASSVFIFDSWGKKIGGLSTNSSGQGTINDALLQDKGGKIEITRVGYEPTTIKISDFRGTAFMKRKEKLGEEAVIRSIKRKPKAPPKPIVFKNPFEQTQTSTPPRQRKKKLALIIGGGIGLGLLAFLLFKRFK